jgi:tRNA threonylcarbamoyladenosine biosynthesis protein TsaB
MLILGIDTSGKSGGVTLAEGDNRAFRCLESSEIAGGTFSAQLVPVIASLLKKRGFSPKEVGGFAVASGPGSFTGLRVGLSAVKGLAEVLCTPIATVSILEAIAAGVLWVEDGVRTHSVYRAALDASRGEVFFGEYERLDDFGRHYPGPDDSGPGEFGLRDSGLKTLSESLIPLASLAARAEGWGRAANLATPDRSLVDSLRRLVPDPDLLSFGVVSRPTSEDIARTGLRRLLAGETVSPEALDANYLRRSDAELFFKGS